MTQIAAEPIKPTEPTEPTYLVIIDVETAGLKNRPDAKGPPDYILELAMAVVDMATLKVHDVETWLVLPPEVDGPRSFDAWAKRFERENPYVFNMHSTQHDGHSLMDDLRAVSRGPLTKVSIVKGPGDSVEACFVESVEGFALDTLAKNNPWMGDLKKGGASPFIFTGNSIAKLDIPLIAHYMPRLEEVLHYRIMDVSVIRTWLRDIAKVPLPEDIANAVKKGHRMNADGSSEVVDTHRAYDDVMACVSQLRALTGWIQGECATARGR